jgi:AcrR family transcriptional regulator
MSLEKLGTEIRKGQIAQAALALVASHGLKGLNMGSVAKRIGLVPSALYRHFKNKDEIIECIIDHIQKTLQENLKQVCAETPDSRERVKRLLFRHIRVIRENQAILRVVFSDEVFSGPIPRRRKVFQMIKGYLNEIEGIIRQGQERREIKGDLDPETMALQFLGIIQPAAILWHMSDGALDVTKHAEKAWKIFEHILRVD